MYRKARTEKFQVLIVKIGGDEENDSGWEILTLLLLKVIMSTPFYYKKNKY